MHILLWILAVWCLFTFWDVYSLFRFLVAFCDISTIKLHFGKIKHYLNLQKGYVLVTGEIASIC